MNVKAGSFTTNTATGNQAVTGLGFLPKLILFFSAAATAEDSGQSDLNPFFGAAKSSTKRWCASAHDDDTLATANTCKGFRSNKCIVSAQPTDTTLMEADFVSMDSDGFTINWTTAPAASRVVYFLAIAGDDVDVEVGIFDSLTTTGSQAITGVGFAPVGLIVANGTINTAEGYVGDLVYTIGFGSSGRNTVNAISCDDAAITSDTEGSQVASSICRRHQFTVTKEASLTSLDSDGFTLNWSTNSAATATRWGYVAIGGANVRCYAALDVEPTSTGNFSKTGLGFSPQAILFLSQSKAPSGVITAQGNFCIGVGVSSSERFATANDSRDNQANMQAHKKQASNRCLQHITAGASLPPTVNADVDVVSMDGDGFTLNQTTADATGREYNFFAIGAAGQPSRVRHDNTPHQRTKFFNEVTR